jgi:hypothetical protein
VPRAPLTDVVPRRTLVIIAVVVVLAVLGTVLALTLGGGDKGDKGDGTKAAASPGASVKQDKSAGSKASAGSGTGTDGAASASATTGSAPDGTASANATATGDDSGSSGSKGGGSAPAVSTRKSAQGYSIGLPKGWKYESTGRAGDRYTGPDGQKLLVGWTNTPKSDPVADWKYQESHFMVRSQYQRIRIAKVNYRGWNTADWEFTYVEDGIKYRTIDRGFVIDSHLGYGLMYTAKAGQWGSELRRDTWRTLTRSFEPKS